VGDLDPQALHSFATLRAGGTEGLLGQETAPAILYVHERDAPLPLWERGTRAAHVSCGGEGPRGPLPRMSRAGERARGARLPRVSRAGERARAGTPLRCGVHDLINEEFMEARDFIFR